jgi:hypothetical protein
MPMLSFKAWILIYFTIAKPSTPKPKPKPAAAAPTTQTPPPPQPQQQQAQQAFFPSFGYPANVTEKEAIDWLRSGF